MTHPPSWWLAPALALATACGGSDERAAGASADAELAGAAGPAAIVTVIYNTSMEAGKQGMATSGFKKVAGNLPDFATGGLEGLVAVETR